MLNLITGKPGSGKTLYLAKLIRDVLLPEGANVWSYKAFRFNDPRVKYFNKLTDIPRVSNTAVILDEVQLFLDAREWDKLEFEIKLLFSQHRHYGWDLYGATQHPLDIDVRARRIVENYYEVLQIFGTKIKRGKIPKRPWGLFALRRFDIREADKIKRTISGIKFFRADKKLFNFFDTFSDVDLQREKKDISLVEVYMCPHCRAKKVLWGHEHAVDNIEKNPQIMAPPF